MIPICDKQVLTVTDDKGRTYQLRYLTELDREVKYLALAQREEQEIAECFDQARPLCSAGASEEEIRAEAWKIIQERRRVDIRGYLETVDAYINLFVAGWKGPGLFDYPAENPAGALKLYEKFPLYRLIQSNIGELTGLSGDDIKNS